MEKQKTNEDINYYDKCKLTKSDDGFEVKCEGRPRKGVLIKSQIAEE